MPISKLSSKNQIVLPREARQSMGVKGGDKLLVVVKRGITIIMPKPKKYSSALAGLAEGVYENSDIYISRERKSWKS